MIETGALPVYSAMGSVKYTRELLEAAVLKSASFSDLTQNIGLEFCSANTYDHIRKRVIGLGIDVSHFKNERKPTIRRPLIEDILTNGYTRRAGSALLRKTLIAVGVKHECAICGHPPVWLDKPLTLHVDHVNGDWTDNQIGNLRFLCLHCHSQTETFGSKNKTVTQKRLIPLVCGGCGDVFLSASARKYCSKVCRTKHINEVCVKFEYPNKQELKEKLEIFPLEEIAKEIGCSDNALRRRCKRLGITDFKPRGFWQKEHAKAA